MTLDDKTLEALEKLEAEATPSPWAELIGCCEDGSLGINGPSHWLADGYEDKEFLIALRNHAKELLQSAKAARIYKEALEWIAKEPSEWAIISASVYDLRRKAREAMKRAEEEK